MLQPSVSSCLYTCIRRTGFAFVYMDDDRDAEDAIRALDNLEFGRQRRRLRVEWAKVKFATLLLFNTGWLLCLAGVVVCGREVVLLSKEKRFDRILSRPRLYSLSTSTPSTPEQGTSRGILRPTESWNVYRFGRISPSSNLRTWMMP